MNLNELARELCELEDGKEQINIAQVKEILCCLIFLLADTENGLSVLNALLKAAEKRR